MEKVVTEQESELMRYTVEYNDFICNKLETLIGSTEI